MKTPPLSASRATLYLAGSFLAGFSIMVVELASARIAAPLIGSSVYTWTSVIGITLLGLAIGSWIGGKVADQEKDHIPDGLPVTCFLSALFVWIIPTLSSTAGPLVVSVSSIMTASIILSAYLFLLPAVAIGAIQPMILRRSANDLGRLGHTYGRLSAIWSVGSILGVFMTGFFFVSTIGSAATMRSIAVILFMCGLAYAGLGGLPRRALLVGIAVIVLAVMAWAIPAPDRHPGLVYDAESDYFRVRVADTFLPGFGTSRILFLDTDSHSIKPEYTNSAFYPELYPVFGYLKNDIRNILAIGGGAYIMPAHFKSYYEGSQVDVIDIDPEVAAAAERFFNVDPRDFKILIGDARVILPSSTTTYDLIFGDAYSSLISVPWYLLTDEWNREVRARLSPGGIYAINVIGPLQGSGSEFITSILATFGRTFPDHYVFAFGSNPESIQNIEIVGVNGPLPLSDKQFMDAITRGPNPFLAHRLVSRNKLPTSTGPILSDDLAPVERLMRPVLSKYFADHRAWAAGIY